MRFRRKSTGPADAALIADLRHACARYETELATARRLVVALVFREHAGVLSDKEHRFLCDALASEERRPLP